jgi:hypothetical protein
MIVFLFFFFYLPPEELESLGPGGRESHGLSWLPAAEAWMRSRCRETRPVHRAVCTCAVAAQGIQVISSIGFGKGFSTSIFA